MMPKPLLPQQSLVLPWPSNAGGVLILHAIDAARNVKRRYVIRQMQDLFGGCVVESEWGRIGTRGQSRRRLFTDPAEADRFVRQLLVRRASLERRIGVPYRPV